MRTWFGSSDSITFDSLTAFDKQSPILSFSSAAFLIWLPHIKGWPEGLSNCGSLIPEGWGTDFQAGVGCRMNGFNSPKLKEAIGKMQITKAVKNHLGLRVSFTNQGKLENIAMF